MLAAPILCLALASCGGQPSQTLDATSIVATPTAPATPAAAPAATASLAIDSTLQAKRDAFARQLVTLTFEGQRWQPSATDLGASLASADNTLRVTVDAATIRVYLSKIASEIEIAPVDAQISVSTNELLTSAAKPGLKLDIDTTIAAIAKALESTAAQTVAITTQVTDPQISDAAAQAAKTKAEALIEQPLTLMVGTKSYTWDSETLAPLLSFSKSPATTSVELNIALDPAALADQVKQLADRSAYPASNPRARWNNGTLAVFEDGKPGTRIDEAKAAAAIMSAFASKNRTVTLPTQTVQPQVTAANINNLSIKEVVSVGKSDFTGSAQYRITNILAGMKLLDGTLIAPGEEFSFNNTVGEIDATTGFVEGHAIVNNRTQIEFGGGICQDSTTVFRAAFWAGLPITERKEHTYYISWYNKYGLGAQGDGPGLDAAIYTGVQDLKFVNDTGAWMLIQASADVKRVLAQVTLYGSKPNRQVLISHKIVSRSPAISRPDYFADPAQPVGTMKRTDTARGGMKIDVYRTVTENGTPRPPELFRTSFRPWSNKYAVNPADIGPNGIPLFLTTPTTPTVDPALQPTADPSAPQPTADPNAQPPTVDPNAPPTIDPNAPQSTPVPANPNIPQPTADPNAQPAPADPNAPPQPTADPNAQPTPVPAPA